MKGKNHFLRKETSAIRKMRFEVGKTPFTNGSSTKTQLKTRPTMLKITFQQNKQSSSTRMVTNSTVHTLKENNNNNNRPDAHPNLPKIKQQSIKESPFDKTMPSDGDSDECVFVKEENDEVIFVSETSCDIPVSQNEKNRVKGNAKHFGVNGGKVRILKYTSVASMGDNNFKFKFQITKKRHTPYRRFPRNIKKVIENKIQSEEINRFDPTTTANVPALFPIDDIKLNPVALLNPLPNQPMTNEAEEKLFAERPDSFEKRMVIIDGSNVAHQYAHIFIYFVSVFFFI